MNIFASASHTDSSPCFHSSSQRGGANLSLLMFVLLVAVSGYAAAQYVPVAMRARIFQDTMQTKVNQAAVTNRPTDWLITQLRADLQDAHLPEDALVNVSQSERRIIANVQFTKSIPLPGYIYQYDFNYSVRSGSFLAGQ